MFASPAWQQLGSPDVRYIVAWDALDVALAARGDRRLHGGGGERRRARAPRLQPLALALQARAQVAALAAPLPARVQALPGALPVHHELPDLERGEPPRPADVEPPEAGRPLLRHPAHRLPRVHDRRALGARLDQDAALGQAGGEGREDADRDLGDPQLHRRQPLPHARHALAAARDEGEDLVHRDRRPRAPRQRLEDRVRRVAEARGAGDEVGAQARAHQPPRPARLLLPLDRARPQGHLGLRADRPPRQAAARLQGRAHVRAPAAGGVAPGARRR